MTNKQPNITHLKQGQTIPDPIHKAKLDGTHFKGTAKETTIYPTPNSAPKSNDGSLSQKNTPNGGKDWYMPDALSKSNSWTGKNGSTRPGDKSD